MGALSTTTKPKVGMEDDDLFFSEFGAKLHPSKSVWLVKKSTRPRKTRRAKKDKSALFLSPARGQTFASSIYAAITNLRAGWLIPTLHEIATMKPY